MVIFSLALGHHHIQSSNANIPMNRMPEAHKVSRPPGALIHWPLRYDLLVGLLTLGHERPFREKLVRLARIKPGESVLDVGCGTGSLAIAAWRAVGPGGVIHGVDASPEMIARAEKKANRAGAEVHFRTGAAQSLPHSDGTFDAVLMTVMLHHLPRKVRLDAVIEARRVLKPGGRLFVVEFGAAGPRKGIIAHLHRHRHIPSADTIALLRESGLEIVDSGDVGTGGLHFVLGAAPRTR